MSQLLDAVRLNKLDLVESLIDIHDRDEIGDSVLHYAVKYNHLDMVRLLISLGVDVNDRNKWCRTPLYYAVENDSIEMIRLLVDLGANLNSHPVYSLLDHAHHHRSSKASLELLRLGAKWDERTVSWAINYPNSDLLNLLIEKGFDVNEHSYLIIFCSCREIKIDKLQLLLKAGANVNFCDKNNKTALCHLADHTYQDDRWEEIRLLLEYKADPNIGSETPLSKIVNRNSPKSVRLLLEYGAHCVNMGPRYISYMISNFTFDESIIHDLLLYGMDVNAISDGMSLLDAAMLFNNNENLITLLINFGFDFNTHQLINPDTLQKDIMDTLVYYGGISADFSKLNKTNFQDHVSRNLRKYQKLDKIISNPTKQFFEKNILPEIVTKVNEILFRPGSIRYQITECHWRLDDYEKMKEKYPNLM